MEKIPPDAAFFLFFSTHDIHVPRGNTMVEIDWCVGELNKALAKHGFADNTLLLFSSDNGPVLDDDYQDDANEKRNGHEPAGPWRAGKYSSFEGCTRVPLIAHYPKVIEPGVSSTLLSQVDPLASLAELTGATLPAVAYSTDEYRRLYFTVRFFTGSVVWRYAIYFVVALDFLLDTT